MAFKIEVDGNLSQRWQDRVGKMREKIFQWIDTQVRMMASMMESEMKADIASAGNFGPSWTQGLHVTVEGAAPNMKIAFAHDIPFFNIFETGGVIHGNPLLWIPLSGTDAMGQRASDFGGLVSAKYPRKTGRPLLFSVTDGKPRFFGVESVTIPKKFKINEIKQGVIENFRNAFATRGENISLG